MGKMTQNFFAVSCIQKNDTFSSEEDFEKKKKFRC